MNNAETLRDFISSLPVPADAEECADAAFSDALDDLSLLLVNYRMDHGLTQEQLARLLGISQPMVCEYERGARNPSLQTLCQLFAKLGRSLTLSSREFPAPDERASGSLARG